LHRFWWDGGRCARVTRPLVCDAVHCFDGLHAVGAQSPSAIMQDDDGARRGARQHVIRDEINPWSL
jgi:hypothetical protein